MDSLQKQHWTPKLWRISVKGFGQWRTLKITELHHFPSGSQFCEPCFSQGAEEGGLPCCRSRKGVRVAIRRQYSVGNERLLKHITRLMEDLCTECVSNALEILKVGQNKSLSVYNNHHQNYPYIIHRKLDIIINSSSSRVGQGGQGSTHRKARPEAVKSL